MPEQPGRPLLATLSDVLRPKRLLLVLDNCEHLVAACAALADSLLLTCPGLRILATSREALNIPGEIVWQVPSLTSPDALPASGGPPLGHLARYEAVRLFVDRAVGARSTFTVTPQSAPAVAQICHRLDGIPLALELAAARVKALSVEQIAARLDDRFRLLTGGHRTALPRHQTLRATVDWSYALLSEPERTLFNRLSVFAGGWTLEAAEAICAGEGIEAGEVFELLAQLVDKSLVLAEERSGEVRYRLLETIRQYGAEKLRQAGEEVVQRERHRDWYLRLAEQAEPKLKGPEQAAWLNRLAIEHDNLRAALEWGRLEALAGSEPAPSLSIGQALERSAGTEHGGAEAGQAGLRLVGALWWFWRLRGYLSEGRKWLAEALARAPERTVARAKALHGAGWLAFVQGDFPAARHLLEESLAVAREVGYRQDIASCLSNLGFLALAQGDQAAAHALYQEGVVVAREVGDGWGLGWALLRAGNAALDEDDNAAARALLEESLAVRRELGDQQGSALSLLFLGLTAFRQGDHAAARALYQESLVL